MGVHITLETKDGREHPDWDWIRHSGDSEVSVILSNGLTSPADYDPWVHGDNVLFRPADLDALDAAEWPSDNPERWVQLRKILRDEPDYWVRVSN